MKAKKGFRLFYDTFVNVNDYIPQNKWQAEMVILMKMNGNLTFLVPKMA